MKRFDASGALLCARYAFAPNFYHYCGPETNGELGDKVSESVVDAGVVENLAKFETLSPYLLAIAHAHGLKDPFDKRVVEAYWVGNELLESIDEKHTALTFIDYQHLPKRLSPKEMKWLMPKIDKRARLHHSFHVFNVFTRTGHATVPHTVETMDECRISWGEIINSKFEILNSKQIKNTKVKMKSQKLIYKNGKLELVPSEREVTIASESLGRRLKTGVMLSSHWGFGCDVLSDIQVKYLHHYTNYHLRLANETL